MRQPFVDHEVLLKKHLQFLVWDEGSDYLAATGRYDRYPGFSPEELAELRKISATIET
jgi:hypothetical protein